MTRSRCFPSFDILLATLVLCSLPFSGCAFGSKMSFDATEVVVPSVSSPMSVLVWDARPYVLSGEKSPEWVGLQRAGFGIPYGVHTDSGAPLGNEFARTIASSFEKKGTTVRVVEVTPRTPTLDVVEKMVPTEGKAVLLTIREWKTDTMTDVNLHYDLTLDIFGKGSKLASKRLEKHEQLDGSVWNPVGASERVAVKKQKEKLDELFGAPEVVGALTR